MLENELVLFHLFGFLPFSLISLLDILLVAFIFNRLLALIKGCLLYTSPSPRD